MADFILKTDVNTEPNQHSQQIKVSFLLQEIRQQKELIDEYDALLKINKSGLRYASAAPTNDFSQPENLAYLEKIYEKLLDENKRLNTTIETLKKEKSIAQNKARINELIAVEAQNRENEIVVELEDKIQELRNLIQEREYTIQELEQLKQGEANENGVIKLREIMQPSQQNMKIHDQLMQTGQEIGKLSLELNYLNDNKHSLIEQNLKLATEIAKIRQMLSKSHHGRLSINRNAIEKQVLALLNMNKQNVDESDNSSHPSNDSFTGQEVTKKQQQAQPANKVPKLDLTRAKLIQEINANKSSQEAIQNKYKDIKTADVKLLDKLRKVENELELTQKMMNREMINSHLMTEQFRYLQKNNNQLMWNNDVLIRSNKSYEERWSQLMQPLKFYKSFYDKYIEYLQSKATHNKSFCVDDEKQEEINTLRNLQEKLNLDISQAQHHLQKVEKSKQNSMARDGSFSFERKDNSSFNKKIVKMDVRQSVLKNLTLQTSKEYLINLGRDLHEGPWKIYQKSIYITEYGTGDQNRKKRRSFSSVLDYVFQPFNNKEEDDLMQSIKKGMITSKNNPGFTYKTVFGKVGQKIITATDFNK